LPYKELPAEENRKHVNDFLAVDFVSAMAQLLPLVEAKLFGGGK